MGLFKTLNIISEIVKDTIITTNAIEENIKCKEDGKIIVYGEGYDNRCRFCNYMDDVVKSYFKSNNRDGRIEFNCKFKSDQSFSYSQSSKDSINELLKKLGQQNKSH